MNIFLVSNILKNPLTIVAFIVALIVLIIIIVVGVFIISRSRKKRQIKELEVKYGFIHDRLVNDDKNMIARLEFISTNNFAYLQIHQQYLERYNTILDKQDKQCFIAINSLNELATAKNFKKMKEIIESTRLSVLDFDKLVNSLNDDLWTLLKPDEEIRQLAIREKEKLRNLKDDFNNHYTELKSLEESFTLVFNAIETMFTEFEQLLDAANYDEANEKLPPISKLLDALTKMMVDLPFIITLATQVVPQRIAELQESYEKLEQEKYPLHHLQIKVTIEKMETELDDIASRLKDFKLEGVKDELDKMTDQIDIFFRQFEEEKEAKSLFDKEQADISNNTYELEREFAKLKRYLPEYKNIYVIDDKYLDQLTLIQNDIDRMSAIKRDLDTFIHSSTKQPYSILLKKMKDLQIEIKKITSTLNDFHDYLGSLKADSEGAYAEIRTYYVKLKEAECKIREINVAALSDYLSLRFKQGYAYLDNLNDIINSQPIDVKKLDAVYNEAVVHIDSVLAEVATEDELSLRAEDSIVYANQYRVDFSEVRVSLNTAESAFQEADFARASSEALTVIKKVRVEQGE